MKKKPMKMMMVFMQLSIYAFKVLGKITSWNQWTILISDEEEDEDAKAEDGACGRTTGDLAGMSSDEDSDKCPICLNSFISQLVATPENCEHYFCLDCILEWTKVGVSWCIFLK